MEGQTETIKLIYAYVTYVGLSMLYTLINVPYGALNSSLTRDTDEITILTSVRMLWQMWVDSVYRQVFQSW